MTAQRTDTDIINNNEHKLYSLPLNQYWDKFGQTVSLLDISAELWRVYDATWLLENNKLSFAAESHPSFVFKPWTRRC